jgi:hypothetical protein
MKYRAVIEAPEAFGSNTFGIDLLCETVQEAVDWLAVEAEKLRRWPLAYTVDVRIELADVSLAAIKAAANGK